MGKFLEQLDIAQTQLTADIFSVHYQRLNQSDLGGSVILEALCIAF